MNAPQFMNHRHHLAPISAPIFLTAILFSKEKMNAVLKYSTSVWVVTVLAACGGGGGSAPSATASGAQDLSPVAAADPAASGVPVPPQATGYTTVLPEGAKYTPDDVKKTAALGVVVTNSLTGSSPVFGGLSLLSSYLHASSSNEGLQGGRTMPVTCSATNGGKASVDIVKTGIHKGFVKGDVLTYTFTQCGSANDKAIINGTAKLTVQKIQDSEILDKGLTVHFTTDLSNFSTSFNGRTVVMNGSSDVMYDLGAKASVSFGGNLSFAMAIPASKNLTAVFSGKGAPLNLRYQSGFGFSWAQSSNKLDGLVDVLSPTGDITLRMATGTVLSGPEPDGNFVPVSGVLSTQSVKHNLTTTTTFSASSASVNGDVDRDAVLDTVVNTNWAELNQLPASAPFIVSPPPATPAANGAKAVVVTPVTAKTPWNLNTPAQFSLTNAAGAAVGGVLSCQSDTPERLVVAPDCSTLKGLRLGVHTVTVSAAGVKAEAKVQVVPQAQPLASTHNAKYDNMVLTPDGRLLSWGKDMRLEPDAALPQTGRNRDGRGNVINNIVAASSGEEVSMALTQDGEVYSWGLGVAMGRLVPKDFNLDFFPGKVSDPTGHPALKNIVQISAGYRNVVALKDDGTVYAWGTYKGGTFATDGSLAEMLPSVVPTPSKAVAVSTGRNWSAALLADGRVLTWPSTNGSDLYLGHPKVDAAGNSTPLGLVIDQRTGKPLEGVVGISAGYNHGLAVSAEGQVFAWGDNKTGALGQNTEDVGVAAAVLVKAPDGAANLSGITMVTAGYGHSMALDKAGKVYSWGNNYSSQLGGGASQVSSAKLPKAVVGVGGVGELSGVRSIAALFEQSLALTTDGTLLAWGRGSYASLGQGVLNTSSESSVPLLVKNEAGTAPLSFGPLAYWPNLLRESRP
jgi:alpha-tubulin suppressor-like RCC1 family protein